MESFPKLLIIQLNHDKQTINEASINRPSSYKALMKVILENFEINSFNMYYFDQNNNEVYINNNEQFKKSGNMIFIIENNVLNVLNESIYDRIRKHLSDSKMDGIDEKYLCNLCTEKFTQNPYYCYRCSKKFCEKCFKKLKDIGFPNPLKCPFCKFEAEFDEWFTLPNFMEEKQKYLELIEENIKLKEENLAYNKKEIEFINKITKLNVLVEKTEETIKILNVEIREAHKKMKNQEKIIQDKDEKIKKLDDIINGLNQLHQNKINEKNEVIVNLLQEKELEISNIKERKYLLLSQVKKSNEDYNKKVELILNKDEIQNNNEDYFIYNVKEDHIDKDGYVKILGDYFVKNNKGTLIINDNIKLDHLVSKYKLQIGINKIKITMKISKIIDISHIFFGCSSLIDITPLKNWDLINTNNFSFMFFGCELLNDISSLKDLNVSNGNNFDSMFYYCKSINDISFLKDWNVSNGNNFSSMFCCCESINDLSPLKNWNVTNGNNFNSMFSGCESIIDLSPLKNWNVINGNNFTDMFCGLKNISREVVSNFKQLNSNFGHFN